MLRPAVTAAGPGDVQLGRSRNATPAPEWTLDLLAVPALLQSGWRPVPFRHFVLKIHGRCNLACTYCYMYELADQSWRSKPRAMSEATIAAATERIAEQVRDHDLPSI